MKTRPIPPWLQRWGPAVILMLVIFIFSATPSNELPNFGRSDTIIKKGAHMLGYALLILAYLRGVTGTPLTGHETWKFAIFSLCLAVLYAMTDEYHQSFVPGRNSRWTDVGIDTIGGSVGLLLWSVLPSVRRATAFRLPAAPNGAG
jgi:VanZ family protein